MERNQNSNAKFPNAEILEQLRRYIAEYNCDPGQIGGPVVRGGRIDLETFFRCQPVDPRVCVLLPDRVDTLNRVVLGLARRRGIDGAFDGETFIAEICRQLECCQYLAVIARVNGIITMIFAKRGNLRMECFVPANYIRPYRKNHKDRISAAHFFDCTFKVLMEHAPERLRKSWNVLLDVRFRFTKGSKIMEDRYRIHNILHSLAQSFCFRSTDIPALLVMAVFRFTCGMGEGNKDLLYRFLPGVNGMCDFLDAAMTPPAGQSGTRQVLETFWPSLFSRVLDENARHNGNFGNLPSKSETWTTGVGQHGDGNSSLPKRARFVYIPSSGHATPPPTGATWSSSNSRCFTAVDVVDGLPKTAEQAADSGLENSKSCNRYGSVRSIPGNTVRPGIRDATSDIPPLYSTIESDMTKSSQNSVLSARSHRNVQGSPGQNAESPEGRSVTSPRSPSPEKGYATYQPDRRRTTPPHALSQRPDEVQTSAEMSMDSRAVSRLDGKMTQSGSTYMERLANNVTRPSEDSSVNSLLLTVQTVDENSSILTAPYLAGGTAPTITEGTEPKRKSDMQADRAIQSRNNAKPVGSQSVHVEKPSSDGRAAHIAPLQPLSSKPNPRVHKPQPSAAPPPAADNGKAKDMDGKVAGVTGLQSSLSVPGSAKPVNISTTKTVVKQPAPVQSTANAVGSVSDRQPCVPIAAAAPGTSTGLGKDMERKKVGETSSALPSAAPSRSASGQPTSKRSCGNAAGSSAEQRRCVPIPATVPAASAEQKKLKEMEPIKVDETGLKSPLAAPANTNDKALGTSASVASTGQLASQSTAPPALDISAAGRACAPITAATSAGVQDNNSSKDSNKSASDIVNRSGDRLVPADEKRVKVGQNLKEHTARTPSIQLNQTSSTEKTDSALPKTSGTPIVSESVPHRVKPVSDGTSAPATVKQTHANTPGVKNPPGKATVSMQTKPGTPVTSASACDVAKPKSDENKPQAKNLSAHGSPTVPTKRKAGTDRSDAKKKMTEVTASSLSKESGMPIDSGPVSDVSKPPLASGSALQTQVDKVSEAASLANINDENTPTKDASTARSATTPTSGGLSPNNSGNDDGIVRVAEIAEKAKDASQLPAKENTVTASYTKESTRKQTVGVINPGKATGDATTKDAIVGASSAPINSRENSDSSTVTIPAGIFARVGASKKQILANVQSRNRASTVRSRDDPIRDLIAQPAAKNDVMQAADPQKISTEKLPIATGGQVDMRTLELPNQIRHDNLDKDKVSAGPSDADRDSPHSETSVPVTADASVPPEIVPRTSGNTPAPQKVVLSKTGATANGISVVNTDSGRSGKRKAESSGNDSKKLAGESSQRDVNKQPISKGSQPVHANSTVLKSSPSVGKAPVSTRKTATKTAGEDSVSVECSSKENDIAPGAKEMTATDAVGTTGNLVMAGKVPVVPSVESKTGVMETASELRVKEFSLPASGFSDKEKEVPFKTDAIAKDKNTEMPETSCTRNKETDVSNKETEVSRAPGISVEPQGKRMDSERLQNTEQLQSLKEIGMVSDHVFDKDKSRILRSTEILDDGTSHRKKASKPLTSSKADKRSTPSTELPQAIVPQSKDRSSSTSQPVSCTERPECVTNTRPGAITKPSRPPALRRDSGRKRSRSPTKGSFTRDRSKSPQGDFDKRRMHSRKEERSPYRRRDRSSSSRSRRSRSRSPSRRRRSRSRSPSRRRRSRSRSPSRWRRSRSRSPSRRQDRVNELYERIRRGRETEERDVFRRRSRSDSDEKNGRRRESTSSLKRAQGSRGVVGGGGSKSNQRDRRIYSSTSEVSDDGNLSSFPLGIAHGSSENRRDGSRPVKVYGEFSDISSVSGDDAEDGELFDEWTEDVQVLDHWTEEASAKPSEPENRPLEAEINAPIEVSATDIQELSELTDGKAVRAQDAASPISSYSLENIAKSDNIREYVPGNVSPPELGGRTTIADLVELNFDSVDDSVATEAKDSVKIAVQIIPEKPVVTEYQCIRCLDEGLYPLPASRRAVMDHIRQESILRTGCPYYPYRCGKCMECFSTVAMLQLHGSQASIVDPDHTALLCSLCVFGCSDVGIMLVHWRDVHGKHLMEDDVLQLTGSYFPQSDVKETEADWDELLKPVEREVEYSELSEEKIPGEKEAFLE